MNFPKRICGMLTMPPRTQLRHFAVSSVLLSSLHTSQEGRFHHNARQGTTLSWQTCQVQGGPNQTRAKHRQGVALDHGGHRPLMVTLATAVVPVGLGRKDSSIKVDCVTFFATQRSQRARGSQALPRSRDTRVKIHVWGYAPQPIN